MLPRGSTGLTTWGLDGDAWRLGLGLPPPGPLLGWISKRGSLDGDALRQGLACGTAMASLAIEAFSPRRLVETTEQEITERVTALHRMVSFRLDPLF